MSELAVLKSEFVFILLEKEPACRVGEDHQAFAGCLPYTSRSDHLGVFETHVGLGHLLEVELLAVTQFFYLLIVGCQVDKKVGKDGGFSSETFRKISVLDCKHPVVGEHERKIFCIPPCLAHHVHQLFVLHGAEIERWIFNYTDPVYTTGEKN